MWTIKSDIGTVDLYVVVTIPHEEIAKIVDADDPSLGEHNYPSLDEILNSIAKQARTSLRPEELRFSFELDVERGDAWNVHIEYASNATVKLSKQFLSNFEEDCSSAVQMAMDEMEEDNHIAPEDVLKSEKESTMASKKTWTLPRRHKGALPSRTNKVHQRKQRVLGSYLAKTAAVSNVEFAQKGGDGRDLLASLTEFLNKKFTTQENMESRIEVLITDWAQSNGMRVAFDGDTAKIYDNMFHSWPITKTAATGEARFSGQADVRMWIQVKELENHPEVRKIMLMNVRSEDKVKMAKERETDILNDIAMEKTSAVEKYAESTYGIKISIEFSGREGGIDWDAVFGNESNNVGENDNGEKQG